MQELIKAWTTLSDVSKSSFFVRFGKQADRSELDCAHWQTQMMKFRVGRGHLPHTALAYQGVGVQHMDRMFLLLTSCAPSTDPTTLLLVPLRVPFS